jgi:hypothetical protein
VTADDFALEFLIAAATRAWSRNGLTLTQRLALREFYTAAFS